ncbi:MAG: FtsL-like putative cell division protein [Syntrophothermus sp.]
MNDEEGNIIHDSEIQPVKKNSRMSKSLHDLLGGDYLGRGYVVNNLAFLIYIAILALVYIGNTYYAEKDFKAIERTKTELKELRFQYITAKSQFMFNGRYSEIVKRAVPLGLNETTTPPYKIFYSARMTARGETLDTTASRP